MVLQPVQNYKKPHMHLEETPIKDLVIIHLDRFEDERGFFLERFNKKKLTQLDLDIDFVQDNHSKSNPGVLRGLHLQSNPKQGKLVSCIEGAILDVAVDLRANSKTFMQSFSIRLCGDDSKLLWIPENFAHGFCVLGHTPAHVIYKVNQYYSPTGEIGILWNDPDLNISWPCITPLLSPKDQQLLSFKQFRKRYINYEISPKILT